MQRHAVHLLVHATRTCRQLVPAACAACAAVMLWQH
jgi:hypothetical protein